MPAAWTVLRSWWHVHRESANSGANSGRGVVIIHRSEVLWSVKSGPDCIQLSWSIRRGPPTLLGSQRGLGRGLGRFPGRRLDMRRRGGRDSLRLRSATARREGIERPKFGQCSWTLDSKIAIDSMHHDNAIQSGSILWNVLSAPHTINQNVRLDFSPQYQLFR